MFFAIHGFDRKSLAIDRVMAVLFWIRIARPAGSPRRGTVQREHLDTQGR